VGWLRNVLGTGSGVGPVEARELVAAGAMLLDVREPAEWDAGHVPGVRHVPLGALPGHLGALPRDRRVVVVCRSGHRSAQATALLTRSGVDAVNLDGGMRAWAAADLPVERADGRQGSVA